LAQVAERAQRFDDMLAFMISAVRDRGATVQLNTEERDMLSAAFKGALQTRRTAVRIADAVSQGIDQEYTAAGFSPEFQQTNALNYRSLLNAELQTLCQKAVDLISSTLYPVSATGDAKTFYLKMAGDYYRYMAEAQDDVNLKSEAANNAERFYASGTQEASATLPRTHPVRLGLALNLSVFQHEVLGATDKAILSAHSALEQGLAAINEGEEKSNDALLTLQLLQDNLELWQRR
jgi:14-3-3 protein epsilon